MKIYQMHSLGKKIPRIDPLEDHEALTNLQLLASAAAAIAATSSSSSSSPPAFLSLDDKVKEDLVEVLLTLGNDDGVPVIPVYTSQAEFAYNHERVVKAFEFRMWVSATRGDQFEEMIHLQIFLQRNLAEKRYLLVFHDIWEDKEKRNLFLQSVARYGGYGSKILLTTVDVRITDIPRPILLNIFSRLPVRSALTCKSVCKDWLRLISDPKFPKMHLHRAAIYPILRTYEPNFFPRELHTIEVDNAAQLAPPLKLYSKLSLPRVHPTTFDEMNGHFWIPRFGIVNSCNGLICVCTDPFNNPIYVCNPVTGEYIMLPQPGINPENGDYFMLPDGEGVFRYTGYVVSGFGFSPATNQYKVMRIFELELQPNDADNAPADDDFVDNPFFDDADAPAADDFADNPFADDADIADANVDADYAPSDDDFADDADIVDADAPADDDFVDDADIADANVDADVADANIEADIDDANVDADMAEANFDADMADDNADFDADDDDLLDDPNKLLLVQVYTLGLDSWKTIGHLHSWEAIGLTVKRRQHLLPTRAPYKASFSVYLNGAVHWICQRRNIPLFINSFNFDDENFQEIFAPLHFDDEHKNAIGNMRLGVLNGCLCISDVCSYAHFELWVLKKYEDANSWVKEIVIDTLTLNIWPRGLYQPIKYLDNGDLLLFHPSNALVCYNPRTGSLRYFKVHGIDSDFEVIAHTPSLVSLKEALKLENADGKPQVEILNARLCESQPNDWEEYEQFQLVEQEEEEISASYATKVENNLSFEHAFTSRHALDSS